MPRLSLPLAGLALLAALACACLAEKVAGDAVLVSEIESERASIQRESKAIRDTHARGVLPRPTRRPWQRPVHRDMTSGQRPTTQRECKICRVHSAARPQKKGAPPPFFCVPLSQVTCGSAIKLVHAPSGRLLHSHDIKYGSGSGQHSVTSVAARADPGSLWLVKGAPGSPAPCPAGTPVKAGAPVRLQHASSGRWLHTHAFPSPLTRNQEVSAFGGAGQSDALDVWTVELEKGAQSWAQGAPVRLRHAETGAFLASPDRAYGHPIAGQHEVCGRKGSDPWKAEEGVYLRVQAPAAASEKK